MEVSFWKGLQNQMIGVHVAKNTSKTEQNGVLNFYMKNQNKIFWLWFCKWYIKYGSNDALMVSSQSL